MSSASPFHERLQAALLELKTELTKCSERAGASIGGVLNGSHSESKEGSGIPELTVFMRDFASDAAKLEAEFFRSVNDMAMGAGDGHSAMFTEAKNQASLLVGDASQSTLKLLTSIYDPMIELFSAPHLTALRSKLEELINEMKCRDLHDVCHEREIFDVYHEFCGDSGDARRASLMKLPRNVNLAMDSVKKARKEFDVHIFQPRAQAKRSITEMNKTNKDWRPDDRELVKQIDRGVNLVKSQVKYTLASMKRRAGKQGFPRSSFSSELNDYFFCVQEGIFAACKVWGTKHEDEVAVRFEEACGPCNEQAMRMYEEVVDGCVKEAKMELFKLVDSTFGNDKGATGSSRGVGQKDVDMRALDRSIKERGAELMGLWDLTAEQQEDLSRAPMQVAYSYASQASALGQSSQRKAVPARAAGVFAEPATSPSSSSSLSYSSSIQHKRDAHLSKSDGGGSSVGAGVKKNRPDTINQAKMDAIKEVQRRQEGFMQQSTGSGGGKRRGSGARGSASSGTPARNEGMPSGMDLDEDEDEVSEEEPDETPTKRRRKAVAASIVASPSKGRAGPPVSSTSRKRKASDVESAKSKSNGNGDTDADGGGGTKETALERSKRESKEALAQRAAAYVANLEARGGGRSGAKGRRKSGRGK